MAHEQPTKKTSAERLATIQRIDDHVAKVRRLVDAARNRHMLTRMMIRLAQADPAEQDPEKLKAAEHYVNLFTVARPGWQAVPAAENCGRILVAATVAATDNYHFAVGVALGSRVVQHQTRGK
jgi:hypothetical protein